MKMKRVSIRSYRLAVIGFGLLWCCHAVQAANIPAWWHTRGLVNTNLTANDYAPANIGQLKNVAYQTWVEVTNQLAQVAIHPNQNISATGSVSGDLDMSGHKITNLGAATADADAASRAHVKTMMQQVPSRQDKPSVGGVMEL